MIPWTKITVSRPGPKPNNDDYVCEKRIRISYRSQYLITVLCDGVGSLPGSGACARDVALLALKLSQRYLAAQGGRSLTTFDAVRLRRVLRWLSKLNGSPQQATTLVLLIVGDRGLLVAWSGDSRAYLLDRFGQLHQITRDHLNKEGLLTGCVGGDGRVRGQLEVRYRKLHRQDLALICTSDGVHEYCAYDELRHFLFYCLQERVSEEGQLADDLDGFLGANAGDNYSLALCYRPISATRLALLGLDLYEEA